MRVARGMLAALWRMGIRQRNGEFKRCWNAGETPAFPYYSGLPKTSTST